MHRYLGDPARVKSAKRELRADLFRGSDAGAEEGDDAAEEACITTVPDGDTEQWVC